jgi:hypothetical protein
MKNACSMQVAVFTIGQPLIKFSKRRQVAYTRGEEGALPRECHSLTFLCNYGGYLPYIFL